MSVVGPVQHGNGDASIGAEIDGVYVPFASVPAARIEHLKERAADLVARLETNPDDPEAAEAIAALPVAVASGASAKKGGAS